jgi:hypothetical protein
MAIWYIFSCFGMRNIKQSGNPGSSSPILRKSLLILLSLSIRKKVP